MKHENKSVEKTGNLLSKNYHNFLLYIVIIVLVNIVAVILPPFQLDLTSTNSYSLSAFSKNVLKNIDDPVSIKVFFSEDLPAPYNGIRQYLDDLLEQYASSANSNFKYEFVDVDDQSEKDSNKELAQSYGIYPSPLTELSDDSYTQRNAYRGLVILHGDLIEKIDNIESPDGLEYNISMTIQKMISKVNALAGLEQNVGITLYATNNLELFNISIDKLKDHVQKIYEKINGVTGQKVDFHYVDPSKEKSIDQIADQYGIQKITFSQQSAKGKKIGASQDALLGIVVKSGDKFQLVPLELKGIPLLGYQVAGLDSLEERINDAITLLVSKNIAVGYLEGHGEKSLSDDKMGAGTFSKLVSDMYELKSVNLKESPMPEDIKTLIINGPKEQLTEEELFYIDQFLMKGGSLICFVDAFQEVQIPGSNQMMGQRQQSIFLPVNSGLEKLLKHYGVSVNKDYVMDKNCFVNRQRSAQGIMEMPIYFAPLLAHDSLNDDSVITEYLKQVILLRVSSLTIDDRVNKADTLQATTLLSSSDQSWLMKDRIDLSPYAIRPPADDQLQRYNLSVLLEGEFNSYFDEKSVPEIIKKKTAASGLKIAPLASSAGKARLIVVSGSDVAGSQVVDAEGKSPTAMLLHNMLDYMNGTIDTQEMRSKGLGSEPLEPTTPGIRLAIKIINIGGVPLLIVLFGIFMWNVHINRRKKIKKLYSSGVK